MRLSKYIAIFIFAVTFSLNVRNVFAATYSLTGKISDSSNVGIAGATVTIVDSSSNNVIATTTSDSAGEYQTNIDEGTYNIQATPPDTSSFTTAIAPSKNINANTTLNFIFVPAGTVSLSGHIYDTNGSSVANQSISLLAGSTYLYTTTDPNGSYSLEASPNTYELDINNGPTANNSISTLPQYYGVRVNSLQLTQSKVLDFKIPAKKLHVHVQDSSGAAIADVGFKTLPGGILNFNGVSVGSGINNAWTASQYAPDINDQKPTTNSSGDVDLWLLPNDSNHPYTLTAIPPENTNFQSTNLSNVFVTQDDSKTIILTEPVTLTGHVYDPLGNPAINQTVSLLAGSTYLHTITSSDGSYSLQASPATYELDVNNGPTANSFNLNLPEEYGVRINSYALTQNTQLDINIPAKKVNIHVQDINGTPINKAQLKTQPGGFVNNGSLTISTGITNASGASQYGASAPGPLTDIAGNVTLWLLPNSSNHLYTFTVEPPANSSFQPANISGVLVTDDVNKTITLSEPVTLSGSIYDSLGNTLPNQTISLIAGSSFIHTTSDTNGHYSINASTGIYELDINNGPTANSLLINLPQYYGVRVNSFTLTQNKTADFTIPAKKISIHVQDVNGTPVSDVGIKTLPGGILNFQGLTIASDINNALGASQYAPDINDQKPTTDASGNVDLWLLPNDSNHTYTITAIPEAGSIYSQFSLNNVSVTGDQNEVISLQFNHDRPVTTATLSPSPDINNQYPDPVTVTLSAVAANGYTIANTFYTIDNGPTLTYTSPFTVSGDGNHTIKFWSVDNVGVSESPKSVTFSILSNNPPTANAGGPYYIAEGGSMALNGSADNNALTYKWDLDNNGTYETTGQNVIFSASNLDGPSTKNVTLQVCDTHNSCTISQATVNIFNVEPIIGPITATTTPVIINTSITASANFTDPGIADTHTAVWSWGDGLTSTGTITETSGSGSISKNHTYTTAGVYTVQLTVTDKDGGSSTKQYQYIVVYDPSAGFVTGSAKINSPTGALPSLPNVNGLAKLGIDAKYTNNSSVPKGKAKYTFDNGEFEFESTSYSWLVVSGNSAYLQGQGTVNEAGSYTFLISVTDGDPDKFRLKLTDNSTHTVFYDNQMGASDTTSPTQSILSGQIKVH